MLSFGEKELRKYGWTEGKGLGVGEDGIREPIIVIPKGDNKGVGYVREQMSIEFDDEWWKHSYNRSVASVVVSNKEDKVSIGKKLGLSIVDGNEIKRETNSGDNKKGSLIGMVERDRVIQGVCMENESSRHCSSPCGKQKRIAQQEAREEKKSRNSVEFEFHTQNT